MDGEPDVGVTVAEAAARLGVQADAVRKRVKRGTLRAERDAAGVLRVWLPEPKRDAAGAPPDALYRAHLADLRLELERRTEEIRRRDVLLAQLTDRVRALEATTPAQPSGAPNDAPVARRRPGFWERLFWGSGGKPGNAAD